MVEYTILQSLRGTEGRNAELQKARPVIHKSSLKVIGLGASNQVRCLDKSNESQLLILI